MVGKSKAKESMTTKQSLQRILEEALWSEEKDKHPNTSKKPSRKRMIPEKVFKQKKTNKTPNTMTINEITEIKTYILIINLNINSPIKYTGQKIKLANRTPLFAASKKHISPQRPHYLVVKEWAKALQTNCIRKHTCVKILINDKINFKQKQSEEINWVMMIKKKPTKPLRGH